MPWRHKILIIEDDASMRDLIARKLILHEEFIPIEAATAQRGLELLKADLPDLILLEIGGREELEVVEVLVRQEWHPVAGPCRRGCRPGGPEQADESRNA
jgi:DNA-binding response OmpR family regulator